MSDAESYNEFSTLRELLAERAKKAAATAARTAANRSNAAKSTGPKTAAGKAASRRNALKHGLLSEVVVLAEEPDLLFAHFRKRMIARLKPEGELEQLLADRVISTAWRLRRAVQMETLVMDQAALPDGVLEVVSGQLYRNPAQAFAHANKRSERQIDNLSRYEVMLDRSMFKALDQLQGLQAARAGVDVAPPAAIDVTLHGASREAATTDLRRSGIVLRKTAYVTLNQREVESGDLDSLEL